MHGALTCPGLALQVYKPTSADVIIMRDFVHGQKVKEATLRYGQVDVHKKEVKDKTSKAAQKQDKKAAAKVMHRPQNVLWPETRAKVMVLQITYKKTEVMPGIERTPSDAVLWS